MYQESYTSHNPVIKFKLDVEVFSDVHKISFVLWDRDCIELVGITAADLRQAMIDSGEDDPLEYPKMLDIFYEQNLCS